MLITCKCYFCSHHPNFRICLLRSSNQLRASFAINRTVGDEAALDDSQRIRLLRANHMGKEMIGVVTHENYC